MTQNSEHTRTLFILGWTIAWAPFVGLFIAKISRGRTIREFVVDSLASGGVLETPAWQRIFWAVLEGTIAAVLLLAGGLNALQTITSALPFAVIILLAAIGMWRALIIEGHRDAGLQAHMAASRHMAGSQWRHRLTAMIRFPERNEIEEKPET